MNIGEAAKASGMTPKMIRYYEEIGLVKEASRTYSGYRQYSDKEIATLRFIKRSRELGFSIERIKTLLDLWGNHTRKSADVKQLARQYIAELDQNIQKLQSIRDQLDHLSHHCNGDHRADCPIIDDLASCRRGHRHTAPAP